MGLKNGTRKNGKVTEMSQHRTCKIKQSVEGEGTCPTNS